MDAATRRELDDLRRRAYGPQADIAADPPALARLIALEDLARPAPPPPDPAIALVAARSAGSLAVRDAAAAVAVVDRGAADPAASDPAASGPPVDPAAAGPAVDPAAFVPPVDSAASVPPLDSGARRPGWRGGVIATAVVAAIVVTAAALPQFERGTVSAEPAPISVAAQLAYHFVSDPSSRIVARLPVVGELADQGYADTLTRIGVEFGWKVSLLHTSDGSSCIVLTRAAAHRSCVSDSVLTMGGLMVAVPYTSVPKSERPLGMRADQSIGFWLLPDNRMLLILGPSKVLAGG